MGVSSWQAQKTKMVKASSDTRAVSPSNKICGERGRRKEAGGGASGGDDDGDGIGVVVVVKVFIIVAVILLVVMVVVVILSMVITGSHGRNSYGS